MGRKLSVLCFALLTVSFWLPVCVGAVDEKAAPTVVDTNPKNGAMDVDPSLAAITVTFSKQMLDKSWSWSYEDKGSFPQTTGQPHYTDNGTTCVLPVKLEPDKTYVIWVNTEKYKNFKDTNGSSATPYKLSFSTRQK